MQFNSFISIVPTPRSGLPWWTSVTGSLRVPRARNMRCWKEATRVQHCRCRIAIVFKWLWHRNVQSASFSTGSNLSAQVHEVLSSIPLSQTCQRLLLWHTLILQILCKTIVRQFRGPSYLISWVCRKQMVVKQVHFLTAALWNAVNEHICRADS